MRNFVEIDFEKLDEKIKLLRFEKWMTEEQLEQVYDLVKESIFESIPPKMNVLFLHSEKSFQFTEKYSGKKLESAVKDLNAFIQKMPPKDIEQISDGYHTFKVPYDFRMLYHAAFANLADKAGIKVYKSKKHSNGELCFGGGWFVVVAILPTGQITNHYENKYWDFFKIRDVEQVEDEFDNHTSDDVAERLEAFLWGM